jgi:hypothetical protein
VRWLRPEDRLVVDVDVPIGGTARVELPSGDCVDVGPGTHHFGCAFRPAALDPPRPPRQSPQLADLDDLGDLDTNGTD